jgi:hypothetical protein
MADYIYDTRGTPKGFRLGAYIYALDGTPLAKVFAEKVFNLAGDYVGLIMNSMVLDRPGVSRRSMPPSTRPSPVAPMHGAECRRPICEGYPDCFDRLIDPVPDDAPAEQEKAATI